jgi:hypothetical protein
MKKNFTFFVLNFLFLFFVISKLSAQTTGIFQSYLVLNINSTGNTFYDLQADTSNPDFNNASLGTFDFSNTLILNGAQIKTFKCDGGNVTGGNLFYRVYLNETTPPAFNGPVTLGFASNDPGGCGGDQTWQKLDFNTNLIQDLTVSGTYVLEVFTSAPGFPFEVFSSNGGANYKAFFNFNSITTWDGMNWSNNAPDIFKDTYIAGIYSTTNNGAFTAKSLTLNSGSFTVNEGTTVTVENAVINNLTGADFVIENDASLIQINDVANTGNITVKRNSQNMVLLDYTGWSAPVSGQNVLGFSPATVVSRFYEYNPTTNAYVSLSSPSTTDFSFAKGLLVRAPNTWSTSVAAPYLGQFTGVPNNGTNTYSGLAGFNLVGNPYPSPIDLDLFETDNGASVEADYYFWTNTNPAVSGSYSLTNNYASYNSASHTGAAAQNGSTTPDGIVAVGQGFFVNLSADATLTFNNGQRVTSGGTFMRSASTTEKHRLWFGLTSLGFNHNQIAVAYVTGMSNDYDAGDTKMFANNKSSIYTPVGTNKLVIQGRALPFTASDEVALGFFAETAGQYTINLANKDGLFAGTQEVYLRDNLLNVIHDIKNSEYTFTSEAGDFASRFTVVYSTTALSNENPIFTKDNVIVSASENGITINAGTTLIKQVNVFDVRGRLLTTQTNINATSVNVSNLKADQQVLIVQVIATDGAVLSKKVVK